MPSHDRVSCYDLISNRQPETQTTALSVNNNILLNHHESQNFTTKNISLNL